MIELVPTAGEVTGIRSESTRRQGSGQCATAKPGGARGFEWGDEVALGQ